MAKVLGAWSKPWGRGQGRGGVVKAVGAKPRPKLRPWGSGEGQEGLAKTVGARSSPGGQSQGRSQGVAEAVGAWPRP